MPIFQEIATKIIKEQELIIGPLAWFEAGKVKGLNIINQKPGEVNFSNGNPSQVLDLLVAQYERLFGRASREVCRAAAAPYLKGLSLNEIPVSLQ